MYVFIQYKHKRCFSSKPVFLFLEFTIHINMYIKKVLEIKCYSNFLGKYKKNVICENAFILKCL